MCVNTILPIYHFFIPCLVYIPLENSFLVFIQKLFHFFQISAAFAFSANSEEKAETL